MPVARRICAPVLTLFRDQNFRLLTSSTWVVWRAIKRDDDARPSGDFRCGHGNDEKDKDLGVVVGIPAAVQAEAREGNDKRLAAFSISSTT
jgi:hypothetical protein